MNEERSNSQNTDVKDSRAYKIAAGNGKMNLPNKLTISRVVMIPLFILFFYLNFTGHYIVSLAVFAIASVTDWFDGMIARKYDLVTNFGKFLDPIADKVLVLSAFIVLLTVPEIFTENLGGWALTVAGCGVVIILAREIIVSGLRMVAASSGLVIAADMVGKYKTVSQYFAVVFLLLGAGLSELTEHAAVQVVNYIGLAFFVVSVLLTIISGVNYITKNVEVLKK